MFSRFGRQIFSLYEKRPLLMNSIVGGSVYVAGEYTVQTKSKDVRFFNEDNWKKLAQIGALGSVENGVIMLKWYGILNRYVGSGVTTNIVLFKCLLDQLFFATQQDFMFLGLCAYSDTEALSEAIEEVKDTFLTTWIVDCSLWPVVNFVGFAFVPYVLQPTYMAFVSYFWQLYMSSTAASNNSTEMTDAELEALFRALDTDNSNFIDANELKAFFQSRDITVTDEEVRQMIEDADLMGREIYYEANENVSGIPEPDDGVVSLAEFKKLATHGSKFHLKSSALWSSVRQDIALMKGAKHAMKRLEGVQRTKEAGRQRKLAEHAADVEAEAAAASTAAAAAAESARKSAASGGVSAWLTYLLGTPAAANPVASPSPAAASVAAVAAPSVPPSALTTATANSPAAAAAAAAAAASAVPHTLPTVAEAAKQELLRQRDQQERQQRVAALAESRAAAVEQATIGGAVLTGAVLFRKLILKV